MTLVQALTVDDLGLTVKFEKYVKVSSLVNAAFVLTDNAATPNHIAFKTIDQFDDYNSISRTLRLNFVHRTLPAAIYTLTVAGVLDAANNPFPTDTVTSFIAGDATPSEIRPPVPDAIIIEDQSIRSDAFMTMESIFASNPDFFIVSTDPENFDLSVPDNHESGRVTVRFSARPDAHVLNSSYFRVQRKKIQRLPARWEKLEVLVSLDNYEPWVYVDFPSVNSATPVYTTPGYIYFETGYKYRIILSKDIGT